MIGFMELFVIGFVESGDNFVAEPAEIQQNQVILDRVRDNANLPHRSSYYIGGLNAVKRGLPLSVVLSFCGRTVQLKRRVLLLLCVACSSRHVCSL
jgi:hypothetical protein